MAVELGKFLSEQLKKLPSSHPDHAYLEGMLCVNKAYSKVNINNERVPLAISWLDTIQQFNRLVVSGEYVPTPGTFGEKVRTYRHRSRVTQQVLSERIGLSSSSLSRIEKGVLTPSEVEQVVAIVQELRVTAFEAVELTHLAGFSPIALTSIDLDSFGKM